VAVSRLPEIAAGEGEIPPDDVTELPEEGGGGIPPAEASSEAGAESGTDRTDGGDGEPPAE
jgi:hypothetical protein